MQPIDTREVDALSARHGIPCYVSIVAGGFDEQSYLDCLTGRGHRYCSYDDGERICVINLKGRGSRHWSVLGLTVPGIRVYAVPSVPFSEDCGRPPVCVVDPIQIPGFEPERSAFAAGWDGRG